MRLKKTVLKFIADQILNHEDWTLLDNPLIEFDPDNSNDLMVINNLKEYMARVQKA